MVYHQDQFGPFDSVHRKDGYSHDSWRKDTPEEQKNKGHEKKPNLFPKTLNIKKPFAFDFLIFRKARFKKDSHYANRSVKKIDTSVNYFDSSVNFFYTF
jgi:hypothetical protein